MSLLLLLIVPMIIGIWAQVKLNSTYKHYIKIKSRSGLSGAEAAEAVMRHAGITDVQIVKIQGHLTDHYNPMAKQLALSSENYSGTSLAALGVAAHEAGHAIQHKMGYAPLKFRAALIPITNFSSQLLPFVIFGGFLLGMFGLIKLGVLLYLILTIFQLVTLPVEFDASRRAEKELLAIGILDRDEAAGVIKTLNAAGYTYVAAFISSLSTLLYYVILSSRRD